MILVTGGAGFIGSHTVEALIAAGERVRVLDNFCSGRRENLPDSALLEVVDGDVRDPVAVQRAMKGAARVLHLAAQVSVVESIADPVSSAAVNVGGFLVVLDAARRAGIGRFVYAGVISRFIDCMRARRPLCVFGDGEQTRDFAFVADAGKVTVRALASTGGRGSTAAQARQVARRFRVSWARSVGQARRGVSPAEPAEGVRAETHPHPGSPLEGRGASSQRACPQGLGRASRLSVCGGDKACARHSTVIVRNL
jgi:nucleoside-diphosphate-sugar epimerase